MISTTKCSHALKPTRAVIFTKFFTPTVDVHLSPGPGTDHLDRHDSVASVPRSSASAPLKSGSDLDLPGDDGGEPARETKPRSRGLCGSTGGPVCGSCGGIEHGEEEEEDDVGYRKACKLKYALDPCLG